MAIEAALWREELKQTQLVSQAWLTAALGRTKRLPPLSRVLNGNSSARRLSGKELAQRRQEFNEMTGNIDIEAINRSRAKR